MHPLPILAFTAAVAAFAAFLATLPLLLPLLISLPLTTMPSSSSFLALPSLSSFPFPSSTRLQAVWLLRLCAHRLVTHTVAKFYVKKGLRAVHGFVVRRATCGWDWGAGRRRPESSLRSAWLGTENDPDGAANDPDVAVAAQEKLELSALVAALDAIRDVVAGAEPPVSLQVDALERRRSIDDVVAGCFG
ncbi:uncharacterized protein J3D65DRAFT_62825 [Phyllosticta citribraziliensis]|uniref:Uncharacterized protein n=1 Tax=Phyllosticta citribraziliensis TaxID=989973 RepID=A0ABR1LCM0_9PEZI